MKMTQLLVLSCSTAFWLAKVEVTKDLKLFLLGNYSTKFEKNVHCVTDNNTE